MQEIIFERAYEWYTESDRLNKGEIAQTESNIFTDDKLEFKFYIWNRGDPTCCPSAGKVIGTYKIVGERRYNRDKKKYVADYKVVVDTFRREPIDNNEGH